MDVEVSVKGVVPDPATDSQIVILEEGGTARTLPIWVGMMEGNAIRLAVEGTAPPRPLTHDLLHHLLDRLRAEVKRVVIHDVRENTFFATICLDLDGRDISLDARPSDAIALALRTRAPIFARRDLLATSESERVQAWLQDLKPTDFEST